ncbi:MAG: hypothetical protein FWD34_01060 [Oscillospiraceae bacterium]|nr:hypothetical protein [Oscillospiraceae bacterium]
MSGTEHKQKNKLIDANQQLVQNAVFQMEENPVQYIEEIPVQDTTHRAIELTDEQQIIQQQVQEINIDLTTHRAVVVPEKTAPVRQAPQVNRMDTKAERNAFKKEQKKRAEKKWWQGFQREEEREKSLELADSKWAKKEKIQGKKTVKDVYDEVKEGVFTGFEKLPYALKNQLASDYIKGEFFQKISGLKTERDIKKFINSLETKELHNPVMRLGLSMGAREGYNGVTKETFRQIDNLMACKIMKNTLMPSPNNPDISNEDLLQHKAAQLFIAKNLYLAHVGKLSRVGRTGSKYVEPGNDVKYEWGEPVTTAFVHCSRVHYVFPKADDEVMQSQQKEMWNALYNTTTGMKDGIGGLNGGNKLRGSSTHSIKQRKVKTDKTPEVKAEEDKVKFNFKGQMGLNAAIGGLGNSGVGGQSLKRDGTCGHVYSMRKEGGVGVYGGYLIGFESDEYKKTNQMGHTHNMMATGEHASSFGCQRVDERGAKYGGREVDLSEFTTEQINTKLTEFDKGMRHLMATDMDEYEHMIDRLVGNVMDAGELMQFESVIKTAVSKI